MSLQALLRLNSAGLWSLRVAAGGGSPGTAAALFINGQGVPLSNVTGIAVFVTTVAGAGTAAPAILL